ncbi:MAG: hypothetical protein V4801_13120 [Burkholderia gladioli]
MGRVLYKTKSVNAKWIVSKNWLALMMVLSFSICLVSQGNAASNVIKEAGGAQGRSSIKRKDVYFVQCKENLDSSGLLQAAINSGKIVQISSGNCLIRHPIFVPDSAVISGAGKSRTVIVVDDKFLKGGKGVFVAEEMTGVDRGADGPSFSSFAVSFSQPDVSRARDLIKYPPAFYLRNVRRFSISDLKISQAIDGIDLRGDSGGSRMTNIDMSAYGVGIDIDGARDSVRIEGLHFWPFGVSDRQYEIWNIGNQVSIRSARCDDLHVGNLLQYGSRMQFTRSAQGTTFGEIGESNFDSFGRLEISGGSIVASSMIFSSTRQSDQALTMTGGYFRCSACVFSATTRLQQAMISVSGGKASSLQIMNGQFHASGNMSLFSIDNATAILVGNQFELTGRSDVHTPLVEVRGEGRVSLIGNRVDDNGEHPGLFAHIGDKTQSVLAGNFAPNWLVQYSSEDPVRLDDAAAVSQKFIDALSRMSRGVNN